MNLSELKTIIDSTVNNLRDYQDSKSIPVLITLSDKSIGARSSSRVDFAGMGFDWEHGQFRLEPSKRLGIMGYKSKDVMPYVCELHQGKNYYFCAYCESRVAKNDKFCKHCGQRMG